MEYKSFEDYGLTFDENAGCVTCKGGSGGCHTNVNSLKDGREYNVHIAINANKTVYSIHATQKATTQSTSTIDEIFHNEAQAVKFLCENFERFKCF